MGDKFRYVGVTDECVECQKCGKADLKRTVVLAVLDADGNPEGVTYYGSTCAARALTEITGRRHTGPKVLAMAEAAARKLKAEADDNRKLLTFYGVDGPMPFDKITIHEATVKYAHQHRNHWHMQGFTWADWESQVYDMVAYRGAIIREAERFGL